MSEEELMERLKKAGYWDELNEMRKSGDSQESVLLWLRHEKGFPIGRKPLKELLKKYVDTKIAHEDTAKPDEVTSIDQHKEFIIDLAHRGYSWHFIAGELKLKRGYETVRGDNRIAREWCNSMGIVLYFGEGIGELAND